MADRPRHGLLGTVGDPHLDTGQTGHGPAGAQHCQMIAAEDSGDTLELMYSLPSDLSDSAELGMLLKDVDVHVWGSEDNANGTAAQLEPPRAVVPPARPVTLSYSVATQATKPSTSEVAIQHQPATRAAAVNTSRGLAEAYIDLPNEFVLDDVLHVTAERPGVTRVPG